MGTAKPWPDEGRLKPDEEEAVKRVVALQLMRPVINESRENLLDYKGVLQRVSHMALEVVSKRMNEELLSERRRLSNERIHVRQIVPRRGMIVVSYTCRSFPGELELTHQEAEFMRQQLVDDYIHKLFGDRKTI
ncbi:hypothetical protein VE23_07100 [Paenibacillus sp. D9]|uniref:hypothetical protein n=1 Tax=Paenibacillus sp. D9 TaxID=665792 RepID=UPI00061EC3E6|nr:hypothetical protein [Paenibacillus sp. D9]KKC46957.1 hypothetical protein VE23_07100 [Paenibacillus sp. D9]